MDRKSSTHLSTFVSLWASNRYNVNTKLHRHKGEVTEKQNKIIYIYMNKNIQRPNKMSKCCEELSI